MSYIYSDLQRSARIVLYNKWTYTYCSLLEKKEGWYIDDRESPKDFWALMCIGHPEIASTFVKVSKTKIKKGIDKIFDYKDEIQHFEKTWGNEEIMQWWLEA